MGIHTIYVLKANEINKNYNQPTYVGVGMCNVHVCIRSRVCMKMMLKGCLMMHILKNINSRVHTKLVLG